MATANTQQQAFNASMLQHAKAFVPTADQLATVTDALSRQEAMQAHLWNAKFAEGKAIGWGTVLMPRNVEVMICRAWDACGDQFRALADAAFLRRAA